MKIKTISAEALSKVAPEFDLMEEGHRFYSEGPSIAFLSRTPKPSAQKATGSPQKDSQEESATLKKS